MQPRIISISRSYYYGYGSVGSGPIEPVSLAEAKEHCRVDFTDDDSYISKLITQCRKRIENYCSISIVPQTVVVSLSFKGFNGVIQNVLEIPFGPVLGISSVSTVGSNNSLTVLDPSNYAYYVRGSGFQYLDMGVITCADAVMSYTAGYQTGTVPEDLKLALLEEVAFRYENRGDATNRYANQNVGVSEASQAYLNDYIRRAWL